MDFFVVKIAPLCQMGHQRLRNSEQCVTFQSIVKNTECPPSAHRVWQHLLRPCWAGNLWVPNTIKHCGDQPCWCCTEWPNGVYQIYFEEQNVLQCSMEVLSSLKFFQTRSNKVSKRENIWSRNNVWSCLIAKHFLFGQGFTQVEPLRIFYKCCLNN